MPADVEIGGAYLPPIAQALLLAWLIFLLLNPLLRASACCSGCGTKRCSRARCTARSALV